MLGEGAPGEKFFRGRGGILFIVIPLTERFLKGCQVLDRSWAEGHQREQQFGGNRGERDGLTEVSYSDLPLIEEQRQVRKIIKLGE